MHLSVAAVVATLAGGGIENNRAIDLAGCGVKMNFAALNLEFPMDRMEEVPKGELRCSLCRIT